MIVYRPKRKTLSASAKEELFFETIDDMILHLFHLYRRVSNYIGAVQPFMADDIILDGNLVKIRRLSGTVYNTPHCVGLFVEC